MGTAPRAPRIVGLWGSLSGQSAVVCISQVRSVERHNNALLEDSSYWFMCDKSSMCNSHVVSFVIKV